MVGTLQGGGTVSSASTTCSTSALQLLMYMCFDRCPGPAAHQSPHKAYTTVVKHHIQTPNMCECAYGMPWHALRSCRRAAVAAGHLRR
jgi:hypothetical protein